MYDADAYPAVAPPWGTLNAINLNTGAENYGEPLITAGGLLIIGATNYDHKFRAFDKSTGGLLWETIGFGVGK